MKVLRLLACTAIALAGFRSQAAQTVFVSPAGNDAWSGARPAPNEDGTDGPKATLTAARDAARALKAKRPDEGVDVVLRGGTYRIGEPFVLTPKDSGGAGAPVVYRAYEGEQPVISGGRPITGWRREGELWVADLPDVARGAWAFSNLFVDGAYREPAREPDEGFYRTAGTLPEDMKPEEDNAYSGFQFYEDDIRPWDNLEDALVVVLHSWDPSYHRIRSIDGERKVVTFTGPSGWPFEHWGPQQRYYVLHTRQGLDEPGEWYLDRAQGRLYYYPQPGETMENTEIIAPVAEQLVVFQGAPQEGRFVEHVRFDGLRFHHTGYAFGPKGMTTQQAAYPVEAAIQAHGARHCAITDCEVAHISNYAVWFRQGCQDIRVARNHIHDLGAGGVRIGDGGGPYDDGRDTRRCVVDNNWIHDGGKLFPAGVGVWLGRSSHNQVSHNEISDLFYTGVSVGWHWGYGPSTAHHNRIEYNHIHHIGQRLLSDMGGIYTLGVAPGTVLRGNVIHDVFSYAYGGWGVYPDEGSSELLIENNLVYNTKTGGFHQHYGRENRVRNNIFALAHEAQVIRSRNEEHISFFFERNIVFYNNGRLFGSNWEGDDRYRLDHNCYWDLLMTGDVVTPRGTFQEWQAAGHDANSIVADPLFAAPFEADFTLDPDSPAITQLGFEPFDYEKAGLYGDPDWASAPASIERPPRDWPEPPKQEPIAEDFEEASGRPLAEATVINGTGQARVTVTDERAASGNRSVRLQDMPGQEHPWQPHFLYTPRYLQGTVTLRFSALFEPDAVFYSEWRNGAAAYDVGPSFSVGADGALTAGGEELARLPHGEWMTFEAVYQLGREAGASFDLKVRLDDGSLLSFDALPTGSPDGIRRLDWLGFVANGHAEAAIYMDDIDLSIGGGEN